MTTIKIIARITTYVYDGNVSYSCKYKVPSDWYWHSITHHDARDYKFSSKEFMLTLLAAKVRKRFLRTTKTTEEITVEVSLDS